MRWRTLGLPRRRRWPLLAAAALALLVALAGAGVYFGYAPVSAERLRAMASGMKELKLPDVPSWFASAPVVEKQSAATQTPDGSSASPASAATASGAASGAAPGSGPQAQATSAAPDQSQPAALTETAATEQPALEGADPEKLLAEAPQILREAGRESGREPGPPRFTGVRASSQDGAETLDILTDRPVDRFEVSFKPNPARILVDLMGFWERRADRELPVGTARLDKVRTAVQPDKLRVAVYLKDASAGPFQPKVEKMPLGLKVILK